jgi:hypothetical protein
MIRPAALALALGLALALLPAAAGAVAFSRADLNHDGYVTLEEAMIVFPRLKPIQFQKSDPNGDGRIDKFEYPLLDNLNWTLNQN